MNELLEINRNITFALKKEWFELIKSGEKKEEYREITPYWCNRLLDVKSLNMMIEDCSAGMIELMVNKSYFHMNYFSQVTFTLGYPKKDDTSRRMTFQNPHIRIGEGKTEWGAKAGRKYFVNGRIEYDKRRKGKANIK